jgi:hypothetical protein
MHFCRRRISAFGKSSLNEIALFKRPRSGDFKLCGYAAHKLEKVRLGFIGLGSRSPKHIIQVMKIEGGEEINALCDLPLEKVNQAKKRLETTKNNPRNYTRNGKEWQKFCEQKGIDLIYITSPGYLYASMVQV